MPFLGKNPTAGFSTIVKDDLTPDGSTTAFTLSKNVASANDIAVFVGNVRQEPTDAYSVSGTTLTMTAAPASGINFYVLHIAGTLESSVIPADNTISTAKIQSSAVTTAKILDANITDAKIASGITASKLTGDIPDASFPAGSVIQTLVYGLGGFTTAGTPTSFTNSVTLTLTSGQTQVVGSGTITPKFSTSKILVFGHNVIHNTNTGYTYLRIVRTLSGSDSIILTPGNAVGFQLNSGVRISIPFTTIDAPNTTNELTYSHRVDYHGGTVQQDYNYGSASLVLMEIAQ